MLAALLLAFVAPSTMLAQRRIDERRPATSDGLLKIHNMVGSVRVIGWDRDTIAVTGTVGTGTFFMGVGKGSGKLGVELRSSTASAPLDPSAVQGSTLEVRVPRRTRVWVKTASADIDVDGITGGLDLYAVGGRIHVRGAPQDVQAESMDGAVELEVRAPVVRVRSASGGITLRGEIENGVASSVSGPIVVDRVRLQRGRFETVTGALRFSGPIERGSALTFESHAGPIVLELPRDASAEFDITAFNADIDNRIARVIPRLGADLRSRSLSFTLGEGGAQVTARNFKGTIALLHQP